MNIINRSNTATFTVPDAEFNLYLILGNYFLNDHLILEFQKFSLSYFGAVLQHFLHHRIQGVLTLSHSLTQ